MTIKGKSKIRAHGITAFPQSTVLVSSSETSWTRQVSVQSVIMSRFLVRSPLLVLQASDSRDILWWGVATDRTVWRTASVTLTLVQEKVVGAAHSRVPSSALLQVCGFCHASPVLTYLREEDQNCAWCSKCSRSIHLRSGVVIFWRFFYSPHNFYHPLWLWLNIKPIAPWKYLLCYLKNLQHVS